MYTGASRDCVEAANAWGLDATADLKEVIIAYSHNFLPSVDDDGTLLNYAS